MINPFRNTLYLRLQPDCLHILHVESGRSLSETPALAYQHSKGRTVALAAGRAAEALRGREGVSVVNGFEHPRTLLADFGIAAQTLRLLLKQILPNGLRLVAPTLVLQPQARLEGGLTQLEIRGLAELLHGAGARRVFIWTGEELSHDELQSLHFSSERGTLHYPEPG